MKLIDLLVQELPKRGGWPEGAVAVTQDNDGAVCAWVFHDPSHNGYGWLHRSGRGLCRYWCGIDGLPLADDSSKSIVTRYQYEAALAASEGWVEWGGGECPVEEGTLVDVRFRDGDDDRNIEAIDLLWNHENWSADIIAYRLHKPGIKSRANDDRLEQDLNECIGQDVDMPEWSGDGVPPIGCACEMQDSKGTWLPVDIIAKNDGFTFGWSYDYRIVLFGDKADEFRPLRTEAEKKRDAALDAIYGAIASAKREHNRSDEADEVYKAIAAGKIPGVKLED